MVDKNLPIFVVGSPRSGTSILTWCLGQHPNILPTPESNWIGTLALALQAAYVTGTSRGELSQLSAMGISSAAFFEQFGRAIDELIRSHRPAPRALAPGGGPSRQHAFQTVRSADDPKGRWVDGTPEYSHYIYPLWRLFPQARFIHILRDVRSVVKSMLRFSAVAGQDLVPDEQTAYKYWMGCVHACVEAERTLGSNVVLRVKHVDLIASPERVLHRCLEFLGEPYCADCLAPLGFQINSSKVPAGYDPFDPNTDPRVRQEAENLSQALLAEPEPCYERHANRIAELERAFVEGKRLTDEEYDDLLDRIREAVRHVVSLGAIVLVISKGDDRLLNLPGCKGWHFPQNAHGVFAGHYPADGRAAIAHLEMLHTKGAQYLLLPKTAFWWLDHYEGFKQHLEERYPRTIEEEGVCLLYDLQPSAGQDQRVVSKQSPKNRSDGIASTPSSV